MKKILIIEDQKEMEHLLIRQVEVMGFAAIPARSPDDGFKIALAEKPELILVDLMMPTIDGLKVTQMLRARPETRGIPILVASALSRKSDVQACLEAGCTDSIAKPFTFKELKIKIRELIKS
jgi:DNA-binding response OmpR family regulator